MPCLPGCRGWGLDLVNLRGRQRTGGGALAGPGESGSELCLGEKSSCGEEVRDEGESLRGCLVDGTGSMGLVWSGPLWV